MHDGPVHHERRLEPKPDVPSVRARPSLTHEPRSALTDPYHRDIGRDRVDLAIRAWQQWQQAVTWRSETRAIGAAIGTVDGTLLRQRQWGRVRLLAELPVVRYCTLVRAGIAPCLVPPSQTVGRARVRSAVWWRLCAEHGILLTYLLKR